MKHIINRKVFIIAFHAIVLLLFLLPVMQSCKKLDFERVVRIKTGEISNKTTNSATATGFIQDVGEDGIIQYGHCWSINQGPTVNLETKTVYGSRNDTGSFESDITGLSQSTIYYIRAYATNSQGTAYGDQVSFTIDGNEPFAAFTASPTTISAGQTVNFTDQSANDPTTWSWDFGDGGTSTDQNPSYIYSTAGTYTVILTATNGFGSDSETKSDYIVVEDAGETFTDSRDGKTYKWVQIGNQVWMAENLAYLPSVSPPSSGSSTEPYYYVYGYDGTSASAAKTIENYTTYGVLYNWPAAMNGALSSSANPSGVQGVCPTGWHLPSDPEWTELSDYLGGKDVAGGKLKETGMVHWKSPNEGATNSSGFTARPGGYRYNDGIFFDIGYFGTWWSATESDADSAWRRDIYNNYAGVYRGDDSKVYGFSVRCVKDNTDNAPVAAFTASPTTITAGQSVQFTDQSTNSPTSWSWDFGDGGTSTDQNPSYIYSTAGTYTVILTATNGFGSDSETKSDYIVVEDAGETFTDSRDGKAYKWVQIGDQVWMAENLAYLPSVSPPTQESRADPYYYVYGYYGYSVSAAQALANYSNYGTLYNWAAAMDGEASSNSNPSGVQGVCPSGWHLPSDAEWDELIDHLGGETVAGGKLKETGYDHWQEPNEDATNSSGFSALPGGAKYYYSGFDFLNKFGKYWSATEASTSYAWPRMLHYSQADIWREATFKEDGLSVRCVKD